VPSHQLQGAILVFYEPDIQAVAQGGIEIGMGVVVLEKGYALFYNHDEPGKPGTDLTRRRGEHGVKNIKADLTGIYRMNRIQASLNRKTALPLF
jgi:hypothetical protein